MKPQSMAYVYKLKIQLTACCFIIFLRNFFSIYYFFIEHVFSFG